MAYMSQEHKAKLAPTIKAICKKYGVKATLSVRNHSSLVLTVKQGNIDFGGDYIQVNTYWIHEHYSGRARAFLTEMKAAMEGPDFFNEDDAQTDYFHRSHYIDINIGSWNKPYALEK